MISLPGPADWLAWWPELRRQAYLRAAPLPSLAPQALSQPILPGWLATNSISVAEEKIKTQGIVRAVCELAEMKQRHLDEYARLAPELREIRDAAS